MKNWKILWNWPKKNEQKEEEFGIQDLLIYNNRIGKFRKHNFFFPLPSCNRLNEQIEFDILGRAL